MGDTPPFGGSFIPAPNSAAISGWTVQAGSVDYIGNDTWPAADGSRSLDMSGHDAGTITQNISGFIPGHQYRLSFYMAANNDGVARIFRLQARIGSAMEAFSFDATGRTYANMGWSLRTLDFTATDTTLALTFTSLDDGNAGPALDNVSISPVSGPCVPAPSGLVSWWRAENDASDQVGGNNGMLIGNVSFVPGKVGLGFGLNGSDSFVQIPHHASLNLTNEFTLELWYLEQGKTWWYSMMTKRNGGYAPANFGIHVGPPGFSQGLQLWFTDPTVGGDSTSDYLPVPSSGVFHHLAATFRQADSTHVELKTYVDGRLVKTTTAVGNLANTLNTAPILIGADYAAQDIFKGIIDEVSIYNRALALAEIQAIYNAGSAGKCVPPPPPQCVPPPDGLVSWWRGEANALDSTDGNNGTLAGNTAYGTGRVGQGFVFDGNGDLVTVGNPANLQLQNFTVEAWIRRASASVVSHGAYGNGIIFSYGSGGYGLYLDSGGRPALSKIGLSETKPATSITDTNFHHLAVTKSGSTVVFYIDGVSYSAPAYDPGFVFTTVAAIGARGDNLDNSFLGTIDEPSVYNRALSASEVQAIHASGATGKCTPPPPCTTAPDGLVSWWRAEANASDSADGNHGTFTSPSFSTGRVGLAFDFNGNNHATVADHPALNPTNAITIECWVYARRLTTSYAQDLVSKDAEFAGPRQYLLSMGPPPGLDNGTGGFRAHVGVPSAGGGLVFIDGPTRVQTNTWYHVAMIYDGTALKLYVNGNLDAHKAVTGPIVVTPQPVRIGGGAPAGSPPYFFNGLMDEVSLYSRALSQSEIRAIYNAGSAGRCMEPPTILTQPASQKVTVGLNATFNVFASGTPQLRYQWRFNGDDLAGATSSTLGFQVNDNSGGLYSVRVTNAFGSVISSNAVLVVNHPPVADASATKPVLIMPAGCSPTVVLDGSRSSDPDADPLQYRWFKTGETNAFATGVVAVVSLPLGAHSVTLIVDEGLATDAQTFTVELITPAQAVERLIALVNSQAGKPHPLVATLSAALASIERGNYTAAINQLAAFQNKVRAQVAPDDPTLAGQFIQAAQAIIDALSRDCASAKPHGKIGKVQRHGNGKVRMEFSAPDGWIYLVEASTNLVDWEKIGVAIQSGPGEFEFEDPGDVRLPTRFYRIVDE
jgi:choice-of-anchor C domain-containing protein